jgi:hypothetical protein
MGARLEADQGFSDRQITLQFQQTKPLFEWGRNWAATHSQLPIVALSASRSALQIEGQHWVPIDKCSSQALQDIQSDFQGYFEPRCCIEN